MSMPEHGIEETLDCIHGCIFGLGLGYEFLLGRHVCYAFLDSRDEVRGELGSVL